MADRSTTIKSLKHNLSIKLTHSSACPCSAWAYIKALAQWSPIYAKRHSCNIHSRHPRVCQETSRHTRMKILSRARQCPSQDCRHAITVKLQTRGAPSGDRKLWRRTMIVFLSRVKGGGGKNSLLSNWIFSRNNLSVILPWEVFLSVLLIFWKVWEHRLGERWGI